MKKHFVYTCLAVTVLFAACADDDSPEPTDDREKFIASWTCNENSSQLGSIPPFTVNIKEGVGTDEVLIENFNGLGFQHKALAHITVNDIDINTQILDGKTIRGNGSLSGTIISMDYTVNDAGSIDTVSATFTKQ